MKPTPSQPHKKRDSANKSKPSQNESEPIESIEPHELASQMTSDQLGELIKQLMESRRPKP